MPVSMGSIVPPRGFAGRPASLAGPVHETTPTVHLIARPSLNLEGMRAYLADVGGEAWLERRLEAAGGAPNAGELLVEFGGRACYRSWEPGLNPNVTRVRTARREFFENTVPRDRKSMRLNSSHTIITYACS